MPALEDERAVAYYDSIADGYDAALTANPNDLLARRAFLSIVGSYLTTPTTLLDFGCGTGLDAEALVSRGHSVVAYDTSPRMLERLLHRCAPSVASGRVTALTTPYSRFFDTVPHWHGARAVVSDFAVLNAVGDLRPLFTLFARHLSPPGWLFVSVMNPFQWRELLGPGLLPALAARRDNAPLYRTDRLTTYLHSPARICASAPDFHLVGRGEAGRFVAYRDLSTTSRSVFLGDATAFPDVVKRAMWRTPAARLLSTFTFLVLRRDR